MYPRSDRQLSAGRLPAIQQPGQIAHSCRRQYSQRTESQAVFLIEVSRLGFGYSLIELTQKLGVRQSCLRRVFRGSLHTAEDTLTHVVADFTAQFREVLHAVK